MAIRALGVSDTAVQCPCVGLPIWVVVVVVVVNWRLRSGWVFQGWFSNKLGWWTDVPFCLLRLLEQEQDCQEWKCLT